MLQNLDKEFWRGKRVLITGHTGFKGSWLCLWLQSMGADLCGISLDPPTQHNLFSIARVAQNMDHRIADIRDLASIKRHIIQFKPDIVFHLAAQSLVRQSYIEPVETYATNVLGTVNILEAARQVQSTKVIINVTTDKCYENREWHWGYRENDRLGGDDPYSSSKACVELVSDAYRKSFLLNSGLALATVRAGNVIGGGDWAKDRLIPDALKSFEKREPVLIRNPFAIRPWQHVLEPLNGYLILARCLFSSGDKYSGSWNFGPEDQDVKQVQEIIEYLSKCWGEGASWFHDKSNHPKEAKLLKLDIVKSKSKLKWKPKWSSYEALNSTVDWHKAWLSGSDMQAISYEQISKFENNA